ncbi:hypothetical protein HHK36_030376 [Tetracentron sinense]|uniref:Uncharacterized protein n=1 Tax=Tetracentron sinense TaxID=13715 RepID=A0A834YCR3_TETSI|nr:hypothetical protein HHK36_030376 [Tetracentron sinense]
MERSEPTLVPEWLKGTGSVTGGGSTTHHFASSSLHSDDHAVTLPTRNRSSVSTSDYDTPCSVLLDRTSSSYIRRSSSSNGSMMHDKDPSAYSRSYSASTRCHRDRDWEKDPLDYGEKERSVLGDYRDRHYSDPSENVLTTRIEKDKSRHSQSKQSGKRGEVWPRRAAADLNIVNNSNHNNGGRLLVGGSIVSGIQKAVFERDFPSLGAEERQGAPDIGRVPSPGLTTAVQSLPIGSSTVIGGDGWTSALAEMPVIIGSSSTGLSSVQQTALASSTPGAPSTMTGLNMAETLAQAPSRTRTTPQQSVDTQRLEELAIKQSRQLIPVTPSMPKPSVRAGCLNPSTYKGTDLEIRSKGQGKEVTELLRAEMKCSGDSESPLNSEGGQGVGDPPPDRDLVLSWESSLISPELAFLIATDESCLHKVVEKEKVPQVLEIQEESIFKVGTSTAGEFAAFLSFEGWDLEEVNKDSDPLVVLTFSLAIRLSLLVRDPSCFMGVKTGACDKIISLSRERGDSPVVGHPLSVVLNPSDKPKPKTAARTGEMSIATKTGQQQQLSSSHPVNHSLRGGPVRSDVPKTSHVGKLHVLKPARENGVFPTENDGSSPTNASRIANNLLAVASTAPGPNNPKLATAERKTAVLAATQGSSLDKRLTMSQAQSRNAFFDLMRKKTSTNLSSAVPDPSPVLSSPILEKAGELIAEVATAISPQGSEAPSSDPSGVDGSAGNRVHMTSNGNDCEESQRYLNNVEKHSRPYAVGDEEEVAFLRSLGWDENAGEEEGLTDEEINNFYQECLKLRPSLKLCGDMQPKLLISLESHVGSSSHVSSGLTLSDSTSEA